MLFCLKDVTIGYHPINVFFPGFHVSSVSKFPLLMGFPAVEDDVSWVVPEFWMCSFSQKMTKVNLLKRVSQPFPGFYTVMWPLCPYLATNFPILLNRQLLGRGSILRNTYSLLLQRLPLLLWNTSIAQWEPGTPALSYLLLGFFFPAAAALFSLLSHPSGNPCFVRKSRIFETWTSA